ncbi:hypothetical protein J14TS5_58530 [Paenibacillus lautus]|nr:hypothetical protein J14TS5_58530 [Paenibacillus lautus]
MITIYEEQRQGAVAHTVEHAQASLEKCLDVIRQMDGFTRSQVSIQHMDNIDHDWRRQARVHCYGGDKHGDSQPSRLTGGGR